MAREVETPEYVAMVKRILRAMGRRAGSADPEDLALMLELRAELEGAICHGVHGLRAQGHSWADIAGPLGISRQAVFQRYGGSHPCGY